MAILCHTSVGTDDAGMIWLCRCMLDESSEATVVEDAEYVKKFSSLVFTGTRAPLNTNFGPKCTKQLGTLFRSVVRCVVNPSSPLFQAEMRDHDGGDDSRATFKLVFIKQDDLAAVDRAKLPPPEEAKKRSAASYERRRAKNRASTGFATSASQLERTRKQAKANRASTGFATSASQLEKRRRIVVCCCSKCGPAGREQKYSTAAYHKSMDKKRLAGGQAGAKARKTQRVR